MVDGKRLAREKERDLRDRCSALATPPTLSVVSLGGTGATKSFLKIKRSTGERIGVRVEVSTYTEETPEAEIREYLAQAETTSIIVQLPLPEGYSRDAILSAIPVGKDADFLSEESRERFMNDDTIGMPPIARAVDTIFRSHDVSLKGKKIGVVGFGKLVGEPVVLYLKKQGLDPLVFDEETGLAGLERMDIVISGAGVAGLIHPEHIKDGAVLVDAGTSADKGELRGDIDPSCYEKAALATPVPGGVGPLTVVSLFENVILRAEHERSQR